MTVPFKEDLSARVASKQTVGDGIQVADSRGNILSWLSPWIRKGGFALLDQGLISGSNFIISILLARWLMPDQYGSYAIAFGVFVLVVLVYQSLVLEPMAVFGASSYRDSLRDYLRSVLRLHLLLWVPMA